MLAVHFLSAASITMKIGAPFLASGYLLGEGVDDEYTKLVGLALFTSGIIIPRLMDRLSSSVLVPVNKKVQRNLTQQMHAQTFRQPYTIHVNTPTGEFAQGIASNYGNVSKIIPNFYGTLIPFVLETGAATAVLAIEFGLPFVIIPMMLVPYAPIMYGLNRAYRTARARTLEAGYESYGRLLASIGRYKIAHQFDRVQTEEDRIVSLMNDSEVLHRRENLLQENANLAGTFIAYTGFVLSLFYTLHEASNGRMSTLSLFIINFILFNIANSLDRLTPSLFDLSTGIVDAKKIIDFQTRFSRVADPVDAQDLALLEAPKITFQNVSFSYVPQPGQAPRRVLNQVSFTIPAGHTVAFVGKTGVGKSTITQLLQRFYAPDLGQIFIDEHSVVQLTAKSLHNCIAVVEQSTSFVRGTWYDNIEYAREGATEAQILDAARLAGLLAEGDTINTLRRKDAGIGGQSLSGGEKQRIALARAILKGGLILILDEVTSALDPETEHLVQQTLTALERGVTTIIVTHKLYTLTHVDQVFYLDDGEIKEQGTCRELIEKRGLFYQQIEKQLTEQGQRQTPDEWVGVVGPELEEDPMQPPLLRRNWVEPLAHDSPVLFQRGGSVNNDNNAYRPSTGIGGAIDDESQEGTPLLRGGVKK